MAPENSVEGLCACVLAEVGVADRDAELPGLHQEGGHTHLHWYESMYKIWSKVIYIYEERKEVKLTNSVIIS